MRLMRRELRAGKRIAYDEPTAAARRCTPAREVGRSHERRCRSTTTRVYKTLLESTKAIPWKIDWATMRFAYIGPQIEELLGWTPDSWETVEDWAERMHPDDRQWVVDFCVAQSKAGVDHEADYRALTQDGNYVWIRDVVHVVRDATATSRRSSASCSTSASASRPRSSSAAAARAAKSCRSRTA